MIPIVPLLVLIQSLFISIANQDDVRMTGQNISWGLGEDGLSISGDGLSSVSWKSHDETGAMEIFCIGNFSISSRQRVNVSQLLNNYSGEVIA
jgi:hypothetical protein